MPLRLTDAQLPSWMWRVAFFIDLLEYNKLLWEIFEEAKGKLLCKTKGEFAIVVMVLHTMIQILLILHRHGLYIASPMQATKVKDLLWELIFCTIIDNKDYWGWEQVWFPSDPYLHFQL